MSSWVDIAATATDAESPVNQSLFDDYRDNQQWLFDGTSRRGELAAPVRRVIARGTKAWSWSSIGFGSYEQDITVTFSSDADDGDPNFSDSDFLVSLDLEQDDTTNTWATAQIASAFSFVKGIGTTSSTAIDITVRIYKPTGGTVDVDGFLHWRVDGPASTGE